MPHHVVPVTVGTFGTPPRSLSCDALADRKAVHLILPRAWRDRLGVLETTRRVKESTESAGIICGDVCGPVVVQIEGFRKVCTELLFADDPAVEFLPILGRLPIAQIPAFFDASGRLVKDRVRI